MPPKKPGLCPKRQKMSNRNKNIVQQKRKASELDNAAPPAKRNKKSLAEGSARNSNAAKIQMSWVTCARCGAMRLSREVANLCCGGSAKCAQKVLQMPVIPKELDDLLDQNNHLRKNSRKYNNFFAFTAMGSTGGIDRLPGIANLVLHGRTYHRMLSGDCDTGPLRWFLFDGEPASHTVQTQQLDPATVLRIQHVLHVHNEFFQKFRQLSEQQSDTAHLELTYGSSYEIAAVIIPTGPAPSKPRTIVCWKKTTNLPTFVDIRSAFYATLQYPLVFPCGEPFYDSSYKTIDPNSSMLRFYRQHIFRNKSLHRLGTLFNEFLVDGFSAVLEERIDFIKRNQMKLTPRGCLKGNNSADAPGKTFLPASFIGSKAHQLQMIADALAILIRFGNPTFFITITCNPYWKWIIERLEPGQSAADRPDVVVQVFKTVFQTFSNELPKIFNGRKVYKIHVIEFQKRGLPHAHIALKIFPEPKTPDEIDDVISAELPNNDEALLQLVQEHHIHHHVPERCFKTEYQKLHKICRYGYPKPLIQVTNVDLNDGYVHYRRRRPGDEWVVPYNPALLRKYQAHINVELSATVVLIMYLYKYFYKGFDYATLKLYKGDEIMQYIHGRYLSATEACWRFFEYDLTRREPTVKRFPVHLPDQNYVAYREGEESSILNAADRLSDLERYFCRPNDAQFENLKYLEYYEKYEVTASKYPARVSTDNKFRDCCGPKSRNVYPVRSSPVCRMDVKQLRHGEVWYLRLILQHRSGRSFRDLLQVHDTRYESYAEAAKAMGLLENTTEAHICMEEAVKTYCSPSQLRTLFCLLVNDGAPALELFQVHREYLHKDFTVQQKMSKQMAENAMLNALADRFESFGRTLGDFALPLPIQLFPETDKERARYDPLLCSAEADAAIEKLNAEQKCFLHFTNDRMQNNCGGLVYLDGAPGRGKTFLLNAIANKFRAQRKIVLCCASTGFVAVMYNGGRTAHNLFRLPVREDPYDPTPLECDVPISSHRADPFRAADLIIWDEFIMTHRNNFEAVDSMLRSVRRQPLLPFGGLLFIGAGDFRQIPPIIEHGTKEQIIRASVKSSPLWAFFQKHILTIPVRQINDPEYASFCDKVANGDLPEDDNGFVILENLRVTTCVEEFKRFVFTSLDSGIVSAAGQALLSLKNSDVDQFNADILEKKSGEPVSLFSTDNLDQNCSAKDFFDNSANVDFYHTINRPNIPPHDLKLKIGCHCYIIRNLCPEDGLLNNTQIEVIAITKSLLHIRVLENGKMFWIPRINFTLELKKKKLRIIRKQFPVRLSYAKTINRSQGATLSKGGLDLRTPAFCHGQLAVGLTRFQASSDLILLALESDLTSQGFLRTKNIIYEELLA